MNRNRLALAFLAIAIALVAFRVSTVHAVSFDLNGDGVVDVKDLVIAAQAFGSFTGQPRFNPAVDFNGDGAIDIRDLIILLHHFGSVV